MDPLADEQLVARAREGDGEAFGQLAVRHQRAMLAIARAYLASDADAQDAVQDALVKAMRALGGLDDGRCFAAWLARITSHTCLDLLRARTDKVSLADYATSVQLRPLAGQEHLTPSTLSSKGEEAELVKVAVGRLPEDLRVAVMLRYVEHLTYQQMSEYLGVPVSTVRGRLHTAKGALRDLLGKQVRPAP